MGVRRGGRGRVARVLLVVVVAVVVLWMARRPLFRHHNHPTSPLHHPPHPPRSQERQGGEIHVEKKELQRLNLPHAHNILQVINKANIHDTRATSHAGEMHRDDYETNDDGKIFMRSQKYHTLARMMNYGEMEKEDHEMNQDGKILVKPQKYQAQARTMNHNDAQSTTQGPSVTESPATSTSAVWNVTDTSPPTTANTNNSTDYDYYDLLPSHIVKQITFSRIIFFCEYIYSAMFGSYANITDHVLAHGDSTLTVVTEEKFVNMCLPFYMNIDEVQCQQGLFLTICYEDDIAFLHRHGCPKPSDEDVYFDLLIAASVLEEDWTCFEVLCNGEIRVLERLVEGVPVRLITPNVTDETGKSCYKFIREYHKGNNTGQVYYTRNLYWPSCFPKFDVVWTLNPRSVGLEANWSYLPPHCQTWEWSLVSMVTIIVVTGLVGNLVVLLVMGNAREPWCDPLVRVNFSHAVADLLLSTLVLAPGLYAHFNVMISNVESQQSTYSTEAGVIVVKSGFWLFAGVVMNTYCVVSVLNLLFLSVIRCCLVRNSTHMTFFTGPRIKGFIIITWTTGLLTALALMHGTDGSTTLWHSFYKLPLALPLEDPGEFVLFVITMLGVACLGTLVLSVLALIWHLRGRKDQAAELEELGETDLEEERIHLSHLLPPAVFSLVTATAAVTATGVQLATPDLPNRELICYVSWWVYLGGVAWHPWLYNLPRPHFRHALLASLGSLVPREVLPSLWLRSLTPRWKWRKTSEGEGVEYSAAPTKAPSRVRRRRRTPPGLRRNMHTGRVV